MIIAAESGDDQTSILFANANLWERGGMLRSPVWVDQYALANGYDGVEYHQHLPAVHNPIDIGTLAISGKVHIGAMHMSFRAGPDSQDVIGPDGGGGLADKIINGPAGKLLLPTMLESAVDMGLLQRRLSRPVPVVMYPHGDVGLDRQAVEAATINRAPALFQPTDHVAHLVGARNVADMLDILLEQGYGGVCLDTHHVRRRHGAGTDGPISSRAALPRLLERAIGVHFSPSRPDAATNEPHLDGKQELDDAITGNFRGFNREVLDAARDLNAIKFVTLELSSAGLRKAGKAHDLRSAGKVYARIATNLHNYVNKK